MIQLTNISKTFHLSKRRKITALANLNLTINQGSFVVILGASGCGKSTLLRMIAGLTPPSTGEIFVDQVKVTGPSPERMLLFQQPSLLPWLTVAENIAFGCQLRNDRVNLDTRVRTLIDKIGLNGFESALPSELSTGMTQRVCLARALIGKPKILLLDEPFNSLDTVNRTHLQSEMIATWQKRQTTTLFVTHDLDEAITVGEKIIFLGNHPSTVNAVYDINLPYPRDIGTHSFFKLRCKLINKLREEITYDE